VRTAAEEGLMGRPDADVLDRATGQGRVVVTHDLGFGRSAVTADAAFVGIIYLRLSDPGGRRARAVRSEHQLWSPLVCHEQRRSRRFNIQPLLGHSPGRLQQRSTPRKLSV
jgi:hypothetical protein